MPACMDADTAGGSAGGYQLIGRTLPIWNTFGSNASAFSPSKPWLLRNFDQVGRTPFNKSPTCTGGTALPGAGDRQGGGIN